MSNTAKGIIKIIVFFIGGILIAKFIFDLPFVDYAINKYRVEKLNKELPVQKVYGTIDKMTLNEDKELVIKVTVNEQKGYNVKKVAEYLKQSMIDDSPLINNGDKDDVRKSLKNGYSYIIMVKGSESKEVVEESVSSSELLKAMDW